MDLEMMNQPESQRYQLFYNELLVGEVIELYREFPSLWGRYRLYSFNEPNELIKRIQSYVEYSIEADRIAQEDEDTWHEFAGQRESQFQELIDSGDWFLVDEEGNRHNILVPIFCQDNGVIWRWSHSE